MDEIKSVRVRKKFSVGDDNRGVGDYKVILYDNGRRKFKVAAGQVGGIFTNAEYKREGRFENFTNDDFIKDGINILVSKQNVSKENKNKEFEIIQDPWLDNPPKWRSYGSDPYYLNNGSELTISWLDNNTSAGGKKWSDDNGNELEVPRSVSIQQETSVSKGNITKIVSIRSPESYTGTNKVLKVTSFGIESVTDKAGNVLSYSDEQKYSGLMLDSEIIKSVIFDWNSKVPNYNLSLCEPSFRMCEIVPYISPVEELEKIEEKLEVTTTQPTSVAKEKLNVVIPKNLQLRIKQDFSFKIFVGNPPKTELPLVDGFDFGDEDDLSDLLLEDEFRESEFDGLSESEISLQEEVSNNQEDFNTGNSDTLPDKVSISLSKNLDDLLKDSSKAARILGKSSRVKYENLRIGYKKGIHGLCPQGTVSVLVAMIGIKELGLIGGNADWYSFKNPATGGKPWPDGSGFDKSINNKTYYNSKVRIEQINSSWKGTYLQNSNMWQVGDIIACGYAGGKKYGHIQIWTGYSWMSDFKQNAIQQRNVDTNTVSLWRLNQNGVDLLKNKNIS